MVSVEMFEIFNVRHLRMTVSRRYAIQFQSQLFLKHIFLEHTKSCKTMRDDHFAGEQKLNVSRIPLA